MANWYDRNIMPRLIACACGQEAVRAKRAGVVPLASGDVLELGCGGGLNLPLYDRGAVASLSGIDPHDGMLNSARERARRAGWEVDFRQAAGEDLPFRDARFDTVVCTYTLCSVADPAAVLAEVRRVMKPDGRLLFLEHGRAPDVDVHVWQERLQPFWKRLAGGCHLARPIGASFRKHGFEVEPLGQEYLPKAPRAMGWMEWGVARRSLRRRGL